MTNDVGGRSWSANSCKLYIKCQKTIPNASICLRDSEVVSGCEVSVVKSEPPLLKKGLLDLHRVANGLKNMSMYLPVDLPAPSVAFFANRGSFTA